MQLARRLCDREGCRKVAERTFADHGVEFSWRCRKHAAQVLRMLRLAYRIRKTGVPVDASLRWAVNHVNAPE